MRRSPAALGRALTKGRPLSLGGDGRSLAGAAVNAVLRADKYDVVVDGAILTGDIDVSRLLRPNRTLSITNSTIEGRLILDNAELSHIDLRGSRLRHGLSATGTKCRALDLREVTADDALLMRHVSVDGPILGHDAVVASADPEAIDLRGAKVQGSVRLDRACIDGVVVASGVEINGALVCVGARLIGSRWPADTYDRYGQARFKLPAERVAIVLDRSTVRGALSLRSEIGDRSFVAVGMVFALGSTFGSVTCEGGSFLNHRGYSLVLERCSIAGNVLFREGAYSAGTIRLYASTVGDLVDMSGATLVAPDGFCLAAERLQVGGPVLLRSGFSAHGAVTFKSASIGGSVDLTDARLLCADADTRASGFGGPRAGDTAISFADATVGGSVHVRSGFTAEGQVSFRNARVDGSLIMVGTNEQPLPFSNFGHFAIDAFNLSVTAAIVLRHLEVTGVMSFRGARCAALEDDVGAWPTTRISGWTLWRRLTRKPSFVAQGAALDGFTYDRLLGSDYDWRWRRRLLRKSLDRRRSQPYLQLAGIYAKDGHPRMAKRVRIARLNARTPLTSPVRWLAQPLVGYGYAPLRGLVALVLAAAVGSWVFTGAARDEAVKPTRPPSGQTITSKTCAADVYPCFNPYVYSVDSLLPLVGLKQRDYWAPDFDASPGTAAMAWFLNAFGWIVGLLVVAGFTNLLRKE